jgi:O-acetylhomoserine/O-acetylserine sulfhydrylase-like pyridoxal-dependent enzyme
MKLLLWMTCTEELTDCLQKIYKDSGIVFHFVDMNDMEKFKSLINDNTKLVLGRNAT